MAENRESFTIKYLPKTFQQGDQSDMQFTKTILQTVDPLEDVIVKQEVETEYPDDTVERQKFIWLDAPTNLLVSLVEQLAPNVGKTVSLHTKKKMWQTIRNKMVDHGYHFTVAQVEAKYRGLERAYKRNKGQDNYSCQYEDQIERILRKKKRGAILEPPPGEETYSLSKSVVIEQEKFDEQRVQPLITFVSSDNRNVTIAESDDESSNIAPKQIPKILKELRETRAEKKKFHTSVLKYLQSKEERDVQREERAQRKEERDLRKLELLEKLVRMKQK